MKILSNLFFTCGLIFLLVIKVNAEEPYKIGAVNAIRVLEKSPQADTARKMIENELNELGKEGWELVEIINNKFFLKRAL